jgi:hypothetical protein
MPISRDLDTKNDYAKKKKYKGNKGNKVTKVYDYANIISKYLGNEGNKVMLPHQSPKLWALPSLPKKK